MEDLSIEDLRRGHKAAFAAWVDRLQPRVFRYARRKLDDTEEALDVVQDSFVAAYAARASLPEEAARQASWLFGIASHKVHDALRRRYRDRQRQQALPEGAASPHDPARDAEERVETDRVLAALRRVEDPFGEALLLTSVEGLSYAEVAAVQGCPVGTVRSRVSTARGLLRRELARRPAQEGAPS